MEYSIYGNPVSSLVLLQPVDAAEEAGLAREAEALAALTGADFRLVAVRVPDWNRDLSLWAAPPVFGREGFAGGAEAWLTALLSLTGEAGCRYVLGGYSLAGLFALWAATRTEVFSGIAAVSPSVWFPGFTEYLKTHPLRAGRVYLSLGDREERTKNPLMATVGAKIRETHALLAAAGTDCTLVWNEGNHFREPELRTAKAFAWLLS